MNGNILDKKAALISTYCDTQEKTQILLENIKKVKSLGLDAIVISILDLPKEIMQEADFVIFSKENPVPHIDEKCVYGWVVLPSGRKLLMFAPDYGYPSLLQLKRLIDFGVSIGYSHLFTMIYDLVITPEVEEVLKNGRECSFFKSKRVESAIGGLLTAFSHKEAARFSSLINKKSYFHEFRIVEDWMNQARIVLGGKIESIVLEDSIFCTEFLFQKNHSPFSDFSMFMVKEKSFSLFFYDLKHPVSVAYNLNGNAHFLTVDSESSFYICESHEVQSFEITYDGTTVDLFPDFEKLIRTRLE
jgi:hypothetical protein